MFILTKLLEKIDTNQFVSHLCGILEEKANNILPSPAHSGDVEHPGSRPGDWGSPGVQWEEDRGQLTSQPPCQGQIPLLLLQRQQPAPGAS